MKIHLQQLEHQKNAIQAILECFPPPAENEPVNSNTIYANPLLKNAGLENQFIDCKMETGTGKTYVYTRLMYELHNLYGLFKFIIVVPSLAIKEGAKNFITADYTKQHFSTPYPNIRLELPVLSAGDFDGKKGRKEIPNKITAFCNAARNEKNTIQCLLISDKGHLDNDKKSLFKNDYDQTLFGSLSCPADAIKETRPIVIIDEPHRLKRDGKTYQNIIKRFAPQMIVRFGATFPDKETADKKNKQKDYYRGTPAFDLGAVESFNQGLVKAVDISFPNLDEERAQKKYKVQSVNAKKLVLKKGNNEYEIAAGDMLPPDFEGQVRYEGGPEKTLSNDLALETGMELIAGSFSNSYQEMLLSEAINAHFEKEKENFFPGNNAPKIKTISLFFIDSIKSYREESGWLKTTFEKLLEQKLDALIKEYTAAAETEYLSFLRATKQNLHKDVQKVHAGYFAEDKGKGGDAIEEEIRDILSRKETMLEFKDAAGNWNTRRFLFSKWTLREGWDNPNVFTICKLRSSGSEISKIQEVGRGLRLPVDENGNRLSNREFRLNYIVGWDEKTFAEKLAGEINLDAKIILNKEKLTAEMITVICNFRNTNEETLLEELDTQNIIKRNNDFTEGGFEKLISMYPELSQTQLQRGKVSGPNMKKRPPIKLRAENWNKISHFWQQITKRYMLELERLPAGELEKLVDEVLPRNIFEAQHIDYTTQGTKAGEDGGSVSLTTSRRQLHGNNYACIPYNEFIKKIHTQTFIPIQILHIKIWRYLTELCREKNIDANTANAFFNENSLYKFKSEFGKCFYKTFASKYKYTSLNFTARTSVYKPDGGFVNELERGLVGVLDTNDNDDPRNLYELPFSYDSEIEREVLQFKPPEKVVVYGKLPKQSIKLPTYTGGTTSPDFVYAVKKDDTNEINLHFVVETKSENMRFSDKIAIEAQEKAFAAIGGSIKWHLETNIKEFEKDLENLIAKNAG